MKELKSTVYVEQKVSTKKGVTYSVLVVDFGGYKINHFLNDEQLFILKNLDLMTNKG